jgi:hypothetical protein
MEAKRPDFTLQEYHLKRNEFNSAHKIPYSELGYGLASLIAKGIVYKKSRNQYSIHSQLSPYIQRNKFGLWICNKTRDLLIPRKIKNIQYSKPMLANLTELF